MVSVVSNYSSILILCLMQLIFCKKKYIPAIITNFALLLSYTFNHNTLFCLEISAMLNILFLIKHNNKFRTPQLSYIVLISIAFLMIALKELKYEWLINIASSLQTNLSSRLSQNLLENIYIFIFSILLIGGIPFSQWSLYLFTISSNVFKIICFVVPMFLTIPLLNNQSIISNEYYGIFGSIICCYCSIRIAVERNIKDIFSLIIIFFYGVQILLLSQFKLTFVNLWLLLVFVILLSIKILSPIRTKEYYIKDIKSTLKNNIITTYFIIAMSLIVVIAYSYFMILILSTDNFIYIFSVSTIYLPICIILMSFISAKVNTKQNIHTNIKKIAMYSVLQILILLQIIYKIYTNWYLTKIPKLSAILTTLSILSFSIIVAILFNMCADKKHIKKIRSNIFIKLIKIIKVIFLIIKSAITDFINVAQTKIINLSNSSIQNKLLNILYNNYIYFYIFFFCQLIIILVIECIIL